MYEKGDWLEGICAHCVATVCEREAETKQRMQCCSVLCTIFKETLAL